MLKCNIEREREKEGKGREVNKTLFSLLPYTWGGGVKEREKTQVLIAFSHALSQMQHM